MPPNLSLATPAAKKIETVNSHTSFTGHVYSSAGTVARDRDDLGDVQLQRRPGDGAANPGA